MRFNATVASETFLPYGTGRVRLRQLDAADAAVLAAYRSDPEVAFYQDWDVPFTVEAATELIASQAELTGPSPGRWIQIGIEHDGELVGDLAIGLDPTGQLATIGFTLRHDRQGQGLAVEAAGAAVDRLLGLTGVHRVAATLDPENAPSARLLERLGFRYEGRAVQAAAVRGDWLDDDRYALLAGDRAAWLGRTTVRPEQVRLVPVSHDNVRLLADLEVHHSQERYAPSVGDALVEVLVPPIIDGVELTLEAHGIEADGELVGVVVLSEATAANVDADLRWLLVDRWHQGRGIGSATVRLVAGIERADAQVIVQTRWIDGPGGPGAFFDAVGFVRTGSAGGVVAAQLDLSAR